MDIRAIMAKATAATESMYDKTAKIERYEAYEKPGGADGMRWVAVHAALPCRVSNSSLNNTSQGIVNAIQYDVKLFTSSANKILAGDVVTIDGVKYDSAKEPFVYVSHQEVLLIRKGHA